jgi:aldose 1-epimerase
MRTPIAAFALTALAAPARAETAGPFTAEIVDEPGAAFPVVALRYNDPKRPDAALEARIAPEAGANLFSLKVGGEELLHQPEKLADLKLNRSGTPILFPTPNRVRDAKLTFEGREFTFEANNQKNFIHGFVRKRPWQAKPPRASKTGATAELSIDWNEAQPEWQRFPLAHRLTVTYTLGKDGVRIQYDVENLGKDRLPYGFGLHPWFRVPSERKDVFIQVPAAQRMEAQEMLPTGRLLDVAGTPYDLRKPKSIDGLAIDDVYFGMAPGKVAAFELRDKGLRMTLGASKEFTHLVVFTPQDRPVFCLENQTSSTDAHNLWNQGKKKESHLLIVEPGKSARGWVDWRISRLRTP